MIPVEFLFGGQWLIIASPSLAKFFGSHFPPYDSTPDSLKLGNNMSI
ncbi:hypothetical protein [Moorena sp. SIO3H5]|nr:hypothetical protein [Moorena sp. SIO3H5]NEO69929.1 hypothetical protein [Moorena sp. SIO3H5]